MTTAVDTPAPPKSFAAEVWETVKTLGAGLTLALVLRVIFFEPWTIPSASMEPGLLTGDYVVASKWDYGWSRYSIPFGPPLFHGRIFGHDPARGDVVIFRLPRDPSQTYVKRIIGLPGDTVQVKAGTVFVNGKPIARAPTGFTSDPDPLQAGLRVERVVEHRPDGRAYVTYDEGQGHEGDDTDVYRVPEGHYFAMGDNRDNSLDSRWPEAVGVGFVPAENLIGRARIVMASWEPGASALKPWTWLDLQWGRFFRPVR